MRFCVMADPHLVGVLPMTGHEAAMAIAVWFILPTLGILLIATVIAAALDLTSS
jgi:hypothetical protein